MKWSKYSNKCKNCFTTHRKHQAKGYCSKCYPYIRRIELSKKWRIDQPSTLKGYPSSWIFRKIDVFNKVKIGIPKQWQSRLDWLRCRDEQLNRNIEGIDIEFGLRRIARMCGVRDKSMFHGSAGYIDYSFDLKQKKLIFEWIDRLEQGIPWQGINWSDIFISE